VFVCSPKNFGWVTQIAFKAVIRDLFTLDEIDKALLTEGIQGRRWEGAMHHPEQFETVDKTTG